MLYEETHNSIEYTPLVGVRGGGYTLSFLQFKHLLHRNWRLISVISDMPKNYSWWLCCDYRNHTDFRVRHQKRKIWHDIHGWFMTNRNWRSTVTPVHEVQLTGSPWTLWDLHDLYGWISAECRKHMTGGLQGIQVTSKDSQVTSLHFTS